jgi:hypothetical protein
MSRIAPFSNEILPRSRRLWPLCEAFLLAKCSRSRLSSRSERRRCKEYRHRGLTVAGRQTKVRLRDRWLVGQRRPNRTEWVSAPLEWASATRARSLSLFWSALSPRGAGKTNRGNAFATMTMFSANFVVWRRRDRGMKSAPPVEDFT